MGIVWRCHPERPDLALGRRMMPYAAMLAPGQLRAIVLTKHRDSLLLYCRASGFVVC
jgi:hypothetical protein